MLSQHVDPIGSVHWACVSNETVIEALAIELGLVQTGHMAAGGTGVCKQIRRLRP